MSKPISSNFIKTSIFLATLPLVIACQPTQKVPTYQKIEGKTMGTSYHITYQVPKDIKQETIQQEIDKRLVAFNDSLSTYQDNSTITTFNNAPANQQIEIDKDFIKVVEDSKKVYAQSQGAFDPTIKPILELWGFSKTMFVDKLQSPPTPKEIEQSKKLIGFDKIQLTDDKLAKTQDGVQIDFSAIAKGYGVDVIADILHSKYKINNYMVEIGGEVATSGVNPKGKGWQIAIDAPILHSGITDRKLIATIQQPTDNKQQGSMHLATSGNYRNSIVFDNVRYSHTIDPSTAKPIVNGASSVTVADDTVALADAWATAFTAMPYEKALKMANDLDKAVMFIVLKKGVDSNKESHDLADWQIVETEKMKAMRGK